MVEMNNVLKTLNHRFMHKYPRDAASALETMNAEHAASVIQPQSPESVAKFWPYLSPALAENMLKHLEPQWASRLLTNLDIEVVARLLGRLDGNEQKYWLARLDTSLQQELGELLSYPPGTAGQLMDTQVYAFDGNTTVASTIKQIKRSNPELLRHLYVVDEEQHLIGQVDIRKLVLASRDQRLQELAKPVVAEVSGLTPHGDIMEQLQKYRLSNLPVVNAHRRLIGVIYGADMIEALKEEIASDMQTMVGASPDERALSSSWFAVKKRLPWLQINLLTAFLAAAVVGIFENTIAQYTALAVLLPVAAGQSGNAGAQALAVTMRGLTLREITMRHWIRVCIKEMGAGLLNGVATAVTCSAGVYIWSRSIGLSLVLALAMIVSMTLAGIAGALVPIGLKRMKLDPAQSSSIILTTVTDIAGFLSFLGIATLLAGLLVSQVSQS